MWDTSTAPSSADNVQTIVAIDTQIADALLAALGLDVPALMYATPDAIEDYVATLRLYLWTTALFVGRIAQAEIGQIPDSGHRKWELLQRLIGGQLNEYSVDRWDWPRCRARAQKLRPHHSGRADRLIVAEAEMNGVTTLLTRDGDRAGDPMLVLIMA